MPHPSSPERRRLKRVVKRIPAWFQAGPLRGTGYIKNLSKRGIFICSDLLPGQGEEVHVVIEPPDGDKLEIVGIVRWTSTQLPDEAERPPGFGILIETPSEEYRDFFAQLLLH